MIATKILVGTAAGLGILLGVSYLLVEAMVHSLENWEWDWFDELGRRQ